MNVLIIPEDFRKDQYILKPIVEAMLTEAGKPRANVRVCLDPLLGGIGRALDWEEIKQILDRYSMVQMFLLLVDRDGVEGRRSSLDSIEARARERLPNSRVLLGENAWQEIEVWVLAGHQLPGEWKWADIRAEVNPKETYFEPFAAKRGVKDQPGGGRKTLAQEAAANYRRVRQLCPEDIQALEGRVRAHVELS